MHGGRAGRTTGDRSGRTADAQRTGEGPDLGEAVFITASRRGIPRRRRALWVGQAERHARLAPRGRMAYWHRLRDRNLSVLPHAGRRGAHYAHEEQRRYGRNCRARDGNGHRDGPDTGGGRAARPSHGVREGELWRFFDGRLVPSGGFFADCFDRRRGRSPRTANS